MFSGAIFRQIFVNNGDTIYDLLLPLVWYNVLGNRNGPNHGIHCTNDAMSWDSLIGIVLVTVND